MALTEYERGNTFKTQVVWTSGSNNINASGNIANLTVYAPNGDTYMTGITGAHTASGTYHYYVSTQNTDDLGIYVLEWQSYFDYDTPWKYVPKYDREAISIVFVK